ncbi:hypothetical protein FRB90_002961 [Tulasnella sp. 427]|nr:hypothetical protein FRB90_002961 [Tulasnella sp. 427]
MHPALGVQEILDAIFNFSLKEADLFRCSLVCRLWAVWASDVLYSTKLVPLTKILGATASLIKTDTFIETKEIVRADIGRIEETDWHRFVALSNKVTRISVDCKTTESSLLNIESAQRNFKGEMFGRLLAVEMLMDDDGHEAISLLAVPSVLEVLLSCNCMRDVSLEWAVQVLPKLAPNVRHLGLRFIGETQLDIFHYSSLVNLEVICTLMKPSFWKGLTNCAFLAKLGLCCTMNVILWGEPWGTEYVDFPALVTFKIACGHPRVAVHLIPRSRMPMLEHLLCDEATGYGNYRARAVIEGHLKVFSPRFDASVFKTAGRDELVIDDEDFFFRSSDWEKSPDEERIVEY